MKHWRWMPANVEMRKYFSRNYFVPCRHSFAVPTLKPDAPIRGWRRTGVRGGDWGRVGGKALWCPPPLRPHILPFLTSDRTLSPQPPTTAPPTLPFIQGILCSFLKIDEFEKIGVKWQKYFKQIYTKPFLCKCHELK